MFRILLHLVVMATAVFATANLLPGVHVRGYVTSIFVAIVLSILNVTLKPILKILTFPITVVTLGLFTLVIHAVLVWITSYIVQGFLLDSFWVALYFGAILAVVNWVSERLIHGHHHNTDEEE